MQTRHTRTPATERRPCPERRKPPSIIRLRRPWKPSTADSPSFPKIRKDNVRAVEILVGFSPSEALRLPKAEQDRYFEDAKTWLVKLFGGPRNLLNTTIHADEHTSRHMTMFVMPIEAVKDDRPAANWGRSSTASTGLEGRKGSACFKRDSTTTCRAAMGLNGASLGPRLNTRRSIGFTRKYRRPCRTHHYPILILQNIRFSEIPTTRSKMQSRKGTHNCSPKLRPLLPRPARPISFGGRIGPSVEHSLQRKNRSLVSTKRSKGCASGSKGLRRPSSRGEPNWPPLGTESSKATRPGKKNSGPSARIVVENEGSSDKWDATRPSISVRPAMFERGSDNTLRSSTSASCILAVFPEGIYLFQSRQGQHFKRGFGRKLCLQVQAS